MGRLRSVERLLLAAEKGLLAGLVAFMVGLSFLQVLLRQAGQWGGWSLSLLWGDTLLRHLVLWVGFLGASVAASEGKQFAMDASARLFTGRTKALVALLCHVFTAGVCAGLLRAAVAFFRDEYAQGAALFSAFGREVPAWPFEAIIPLGFGLLLIHYAIKAAEAAVGSFAAAPPEPVDRT